MRIIGIQDGHNASVCLLDNGKVKWVIQEERINREKNYDGFPEQALALVLQKENLQPKDIDWVAMNGHFQPKSMDREQRLNAYKNLSKGKAKIKSKIKTIKTINDLFANLNNQSRLKPLLSSGFKIEQIQFIEHHTAHAAGAYYGNNCHDKDKDILVLTNDGSGDRVCATISIGRNGKLTRLAEVAEPHSIGLLYAMYTFLTGMVPLEHEYKIMGMAPFADQQSAQKVADEFHQMFQLSADGTEWEFVKGKSIYSSLEFFKDFMFLKRFDHLMGGLQLFTEQFLTNWVKACIKKTGISDVALSGGTFMNVKANKCIMELEEVDSLFVFPSCGDESSSIGAAYQCFADNDVNNIEKISSLSDIYFGISFSGEEILKAYKGYEFSQSYQIEEFTHIEKEVAKLLANNHVVARFAGREEFGARSLGNRAILANAASVDVIREINEMIKNRDFWMPFASSILDEDFQRYVVTDNKNNPYYMVMTYDTKQQAATEILAGIHPYDKTIRPQLVSREHNESYWQLLKEFKLLTSAGGVLNTSLNLHGLPLVHKPEDAFEVLEKSELKYLAIENYLISKCN